MKQKRPLLLKELNTLQVEALIEQKAILFLPLGTLEPHGRHLPTGTDSICAENIALRLAEAFNGAVAPTFEYGITNSLAQTSPATFFSEELYQTFLENIVENFYKQGFKTIIIINGHGGNRPPLKKLIRSVSRKFAIAISVINWWMLAEQFVNRVYDTKPGGHASVEETAAVLYFCPELVCADNYDSANDDYVPNEGIWLFPPPGEVLLSEYGNGQPSFDKEKAKKFMAAVTDDLKARLKRWLSSFSRIKGGLRP